MRPVGRIGPAVCRENGQTVILGRPKAVLLAPNA